MSINQMQTHSFHVPRDNLQRFKGENAHLFIQTHTRTHTKIHKNTQIYCVTEDSF